MPLAGRVPLLGSDLDDVLELNTLLIEGLLILLDGPLGLEKLKFSNPNLISKGSLLVE